MRLFHDEKIVRQAAFAAVCRAVADGRLSLKEGRFFNRNEVGASHGDDFTFSDAEGHVWMMCRSGQGNDRVPVIALPNSHG
jgi:hypothetical protein